MVYSVSREFWISLFPLIIIVGFFLAAVAVFSIVRKRHKLTEAEIKKLGDSKPLPLFLREYWTWLIGPIERFFIRHGIKPNSITAFSVFLAMISGYFYFLGWWGFAGLMQIVSGTCDVFDGRIARATKTETRSGAFFDSTLDRYSEAFTFMGIMGFYRNSWIFWVAFLAFTGSMMISYTRARTEGLQMEVYKGFMQRPERIFLLSASSLLSPIFVFIYHKWWGTDQHLLIFVLALIAVTTNYIVLKRIKLILEKYNQPI
jgi:CDP-diacylglycerol--glycerol-3-phosphate 3-phosphatidyltransferase